MEDAPYAIIVDGAGQISERMLATHMGAAASPAGVLLTPSVTLESSSVSAGKRTVVLTRASVGASKQHASFTLQDLEIPFINAIGSGANLTYHRCRSLACACVAHWHVPVLLIGMCLCCSLACVCVAHTLLPLASHTTALALCLSHYRQEQDRFIHHSVALCCPIRLPV